MPPLHYIAWLVLFGLTITLFMAMPLSALSTPSRLDPGESCSQETIFLQRNTLAQNLLIPIVTLTFSLLASVALTNVTSTLARTSYQLPSRPEDLPGLNAVVAIVIVAGFVLTILALWATPRKWEHSARLWEALKIVRHEQTARPVEQSWRDQALTYVKRQRQTPKFRHGQHLLNKWFKGHPGKIVSDWRQAPSVTWFAVCHFWRSCYALPIPFAIATPATLAAIGLSEGGPGEVWPLMRLLLELLGFPLLWVLGIVPWMAGRLISQQRRADACREIIAIARTPPTSPSLPLNLPPLESRITLFGRTILVRSVCAVGHATAGGAARSQP